MKTYQARLLILLSALLFSSGALIAKLVSFQPLTLVFFRGITGVPLMLIYIFLVKSEGRIPQEILKDSFHSRKKVLSMIAGAIAYSIAGLSFFLALRLTTAANTTLFQQTSPVWVAILGFVFLKEKVSVKYVIFIVIVMTGIFLCMSGNFDASGIRGNILALISGFAMAVLVVFMRMVDERSSLMALAAGMCIMVIVSTPSFIQDFRNEALPLNQVVWGLGMGLVQFAAPFIIFNRALLDINAVESTIFRLLEPVLATLWVALLVGELPGGNTIIGGGIVLAVLVFLVFEKSRDGET